MTASDGAVREDLMEEGLGSKGRLETNNLLEEQLHADYINCNMIENGHSQHRRSSFDLGIPNQPLHGKGTSNPTEELASYALINSGKGTSNPIEELPSHAPMNTTTSENGYNQERHTL